MTLEDLRWRAQTRLAEAWPGGPRAVVRGPVASLCFDDFPRSAWANGGPVLARRGVRASFYPAGAFCGRFAERCEQFTAADLVEVRDAGHEIGCHSFSHRPAPALSRAELDADLDRNADFLRAEAGVTPPTFAYPYGLLAPATLPAVGARFAGARRVRGGVNTGRLDPRRLAALPLERRSWSAGAVERAVARTVRRAGWLILFTHDVCEHPTPYGCTPAMLGHALDTLARAGVEVAPVAKASSRLRQAPKPTC